MGMLCILPGHDENVRKCIELLIWAFVRVFPSVVHSPLFFFVKSSGSSGFRYGSHLDFICTDGMGIVPRPLSRFDTH